MKKHLFLIFLSQAFGSIYAKPVPLHNFGATCYLNSTVQCLFNIESMTNFALFAYNKNPYTPNSLGRLYINLVHGMYYLPPEGSQDYQKAKQELWNKELTQFVYKAWDLMGGCGQQDAPEFFVKLVDSLVADDKRYQAKTPAEQLRKHPLGKLIKVENSTVLECPKVNYRSTRTEPFTHLDVPARNIVTREPLDTLEKCLDAFYTSEILDEYTPEGYPKQEKTCTRKIELAALSDIVIVVPKRFTFDLATLSSIKLGQDIEIPLEISFRKYFSSTARSKKLYKYDLIGVTVHGGTTGFGHYIAHVKDKTGQWYYCSDTTIRKESLDEAHQGYYRINQGYAFVFQKNESKPDIPPAKKRKLTTESNLIQALNELTRSLNNLKSIL